MPNILSRFKRSPSRTSNTSEDSRSRRTSTASATWSSTAESAQSGSLSAQSGHSSTGPSSPQSSSALDSHLLDAVSPSRTNLETPERRHKVPAPLSVTRSNLDTLVGTPKLVLTEEGASPKSVKSSPALGSPSPISSTTDFGLDIGPIGAPRTAPLSPTISRHSRPSSPLMNASQMDEDVRDERRRSGSVLSNHTRASRSESLASRLANAGKTTSPPPVDSRRSSTSGKKRKKGRRARKERSKSMSSGAAGPNGSIAAALAKSGLHIASPSEADFASAYKMESRKKPSNRSPWLVRGQAEDDSRADEDEDFDYDEFDDEDDTDSDLDEHLPVTGFAVASNRRQAEFHGMFPAVDEGDYLIEDYGCALSKDILVQGRLYVSENHLCFHANIFGWVTDVVVPFTSIRTIEKKMTALVIPNAIGVTTNDAKYTFASFISRDSTYDVMMNIWRLCNPTAIMSTPSFGQPNGSRPASIAGDVPVSAGIMAASEKSPVAGHAETTCACGKDGKHYSEVALDTIFHTTPEKVYNLMFNSEWYKTFLSQNQKLKDIEMSDWQVSNETGNLARSISYIKPLNASIGPKQTKCHIVDEHQHRDFDQYITMLTTTRTPDVPSGGVFSVKTRTCVTWAGPRSTRVLVTTAVEWTGKSWVKGIIEKSAIEGQKTYHDDLEKGMKAYMKEHVVEFAFPGGVEDEVEVEKQQQPQPTEAAAYAAQQRKQRQDRDFWLMQGGIDMVVSGVKSIATGLKDLIDAIVDTISATPFTKETLLGIVIGILVLSNIYTYFAYKSTKQDIRRARLSGIRGRYQSPFEEAREIEMLLEGIETRFYRLRAGLKALEEDPL